jgi:hypothetical protein
MLTFFFLPVKGAADPNESAFFDLKQEAHGAIYDNVLFLNVKNYIIHVLTL